MNDSKRVPQEQAVTDSAGSDASQQRVTAALWETAKDWEEGDEIAEFIMDCGGRRLDIQEFSGRITKVFRVGGNEKCTSRTVSDGDGPLDITDDLLWLMNAEPTNPQSGSGTTPSTLSSESLLVGPNKEELGILPNASDMAYTEGFASACPIASEFLKSKEEFPSEEESRKAFEEDYLDRAGYLRFHSDPWDSDKGRYKTADLRRRYRDWNACYQWLKGERK